MIGNDLGRGLTETNPKAILEVSINFMPNKQLQHPKAMQ